MKNITLYTNYGHVVLHSVSGSNQPTYHILVDNYYKGSIVLVNGEWVTHLNPKGEEELTTSDRQVLIDKVRELELTA